MELISFAWGLLHDVMWLQAMTKRELHCPNLLVQKVATLVPAPRPVKPVHAPIADIIAVCSNLLSCSVIHPTFLR